MMAVNGRSKLHIDRVWVSYFHRGLYHAGPRIAHWDMPLGELEVLLGCLSPWKLASYKVLTHPNKSYVQKSMSQDSQ